MLSTMGPKLATFDNLGQRMSRYPQICKYCQKFSKITRFLSTTVVNSTCNFEGIVSPSSQAWAVFKAES